MNTFKELLQTAKKMVKASFPDAKLYEADGSEESKKATKASEITYWRFVFNATVDNKQGTVFIEWKKGIWSNLTIIPYPWLQDVFMPDTFKYDLQEAIDIMVKAGYDKPFSTVTFRWPLVYPLPKEGFYIFNMYELGVFVFVGIDSGKVTTEPFVKNMILKEKTV